MPKAYRNMRMPTRPPSFFDRYPPWEYLYQATPRSAATLGLYGANIKEATTAQRSARESARMFGKGMYMGGPGSYKGVNRLKKARRWAGFASAGAGALRSVMGSGAYDSNSLVDKGDTGAADMSFQETVPSFGNVQDEMGAISISHKEYICDIYGNAVAGTFSNTSFTINPGLERTFPWLSQLAANFEEYELKQCLYTYRSLITQDNSSVGGQVGTIIMATNYNVGNPAFSDKPTMMQYAGAVSCRTTDSCLHGIECDPSKLSGDIGKYTRTGPVLVGQDAKTYDLGLFQIAVSGTPSTYANQPIGELWLSYTIVCRKPKLFAGLGSAISTDYFAGSTSVTQVLPFGTNVLNAQQNNIGVTLSQSGGVVTATFPATFVGCVRCAVHVSGIFTVIPTCVINTQGGASIISDIPIKAGSTSNVGTGSLSQLDQYFDIRLTTNYGGTSTAAFFTFTGTGSWSWSSLTLTELNELSQLPGTVPVLVNSVGVVTTL